MPQDAPALRWMGAFQQGSPDGGIQTGGDAMSRTRRRRHPRHCRPAACRKLTTELDCHAIPRCALGPIAPLRVGHVTKREEALHPMQLQATGAARHECNARDAHDAFEARDGCDARGVADAMTVTHATQITTGCARAITWAANPRAAAAGDACGGGEPRFIAAHQGRALISSHVQKIFDVLVENFNVALRGTRDATGA